LAIVFTFPLLGQANYYVATNGSNSNTGTSISSPWLTVQYALDNAPPGATIRLRSGIYQEKIIWTNSGTVAQATVLTNYLDETPILSGSGNTAQSAIVHIENKSYLLIKNLVIENNYMPGAKGIYIVGEGQGVGIENCIVRNIGFTSDPNTDPTPVDGQAHGILVNGRTVIGYQDITIKYNELHHLICGNSEALTLAGNVSQFEIENNSLHHNTNIGIDVAGHYPWAVNAGVPASLNQSREGRVARNIVHDHRRFNNNDAPAGIYCDGCKDVEIAHNYSFRNGNGLSIGCENAGKSAENVIVRNNFIFDNDNNGVFFGANTGDIVNCGFLGNTCLKNGSLEIFTMEIFLQKSTNSTIANNILYARSISHYAIGQFDYITSNLLIDHNLVFREGGNLSGLITGSPTIPAHSNTLTVDPQIVNPALPSPDFHLQSSSPAVNQGNNNYASANEKDLDMGNRIVATIDRGADEFGSQGCELELGIRAIVPSSLFQAENVIWSNGTVEAGANVAFRSPNILLEPGFQVLLGGQFAAEAASCTILP
jgi:hypothetical protein